MLLKLLNQYHWIQYDSNHFHQFPQSLTASGNSAWLDKLTMVIEDTTGIINYPISSTSSTNNAAAEAAPHSWLLNTTQSVSSIFSIFNQTRTFSVTYSLYSITSGDSLGLVRYEKSSTYSYADTVHKVIASPMTKGFKDSFAIQLRYLLIIQSSKLNIMKLIHISLNYNFPW